MFTRRQILGGGLGAVAVGLVSRAARGLAWIAPRIPLANEGPSSPFLRIPDHPESTLIDGLPFAPWFTGDDFDNDHIPFHSSFTGPIPSPTEDVNVAVIGGGLSGLTCAYLLRDYDPVIFELRPRFGGNALGEQWRDTRYSLGSAYFITPDPGTFLWRLYHELGLHRVARPSFPPDPMELYGQIRDDYWTGAGMSADEQAAFQRYAEVVKDMADNGYPEIPLPKDEKGAAYVRALDTRNFREDLEARMGFPMTPLLNAGVQAYFYSSFGASMDEISAASGWNFVAAEEYGRWVLPGGNAYLAWALWKRLARSTPDDESRTRASHRVVDVRRARERMLVTYLDPQGRARSLLARYVVMANSKHIAKYMLPELDQLEPERHNDMNRLGTMAYFMANVLLDAPTQRDFYDCFLIGDESFPATSGDFEADSRVVDMLRGDYARIRQHESVLTLYWPLPWHAARFTLLLDDPWRSYATSLAPQVRRMLKLLDTPASAVRQIRMTRWGHAMPLASPGLIAEGVAERIQAPFAERVFFVNQDNWALPAVENSLLDAERVCSEIRARLG